MLKSMRRKYDTALYTNRIEKIKSLNPDCCIGVDVIVGYPGETDEEFMKTYNYLKDLPVSYLHVFTYSERANTTAKKLEGSIPMNVRKDRSKMLRILSEKKKRAFYESQVGKSGNVIWEGDNHDGFLNGFTENYIKVKKKFSEEAINTIEHVSHKEIGKDGVMIIE